MIMDTEITSAPEPPIEGMKKIPYGWDDNFLCGAFISCVRWALSEDEAIKAFAEKTGTDLWAVIPKSVIDRMIDEATGHRRAVFASFCDWVAEFVWGLDGAEEPEPEPQQET
jgi:hypothetical protein